MITYRLYYASLGDCDPTNLIFSMEKEAQEKCTELNDPNKTLQGLGKWIYKKECCDM